MLPGRLVGSGRHALARRLEPARVDARQTICLARPPGVSHDVDGTHHGSRDRDGLPGCVVSWTAGPCLQMVDLPLLDAAGRRTGSMRKPLLPPGFKLDRRAANASFSGGAEQREAPAAGSES